jgi:hypothetical protein
MRFLRTKILLLCLAALFVGAGSAVAAPAGGGSILVKFAGTAKAVVVKLQSGQGLGQELATYESMPNVVYAEANVVEQAQTMSAPNDPSYGSQWSLAQTNALGGVSAYPVPTPRRARRSLRLRSSTAASTPPTRTSPGASIRPTGRTA